MKRVLIAFVALLLLSSPAFADAERTTAADAPKSLSVRSFTFRYKDPEKAAAVIKSLLSAEGTISIQPSSNALVVTDRPENLKAVAKALTQFDTPPQAFTLSVRLISAARVEGPPPRIADGLKDVAPKLSMFRFNSFESLGDANVVGREGDPGVIGDLSGYRADFKFGEYDAASDSIKVSDFHLSRLQNDQLTSLLKTTVNLRVGETYIFGATKTAQSQRALMIVLVARK
jgi:hypothetical protein